MNCVAIFETMSCITPLSRKMSRKQQVRETKLDDFKIVSDALQFHFFPFSSVLLCTAQVHAEQENTGKLSQYGHADFDLTV